MFGRKQKPAEARTETPNTVIPTPEGIHNQALAEWNDNCKYHKSNIEHYETTISDMQKLLATHRIAHAAAVSALTMIERKALPLTGERGPEAVMPLSRGANGELHDKPARPATIAEKVNLGVTITTAEFEWLMMNDPDVAKRAIQIEQPPLKPTNDELANATPLGPKRSNPARKANHVAMTVEPRPLATPTAYEIPEIDIDLDIDTPEDIHSEMIHNGV